MPIGTPDKSGVPLVVPECSRLKGAAHPGRPMGGGSFRCVSRIHLQPNTPGHTQENRPGDDPPQPQTWLPSLQGPRGLSRATTSCAHICCEMPCILALAGIKKDQELTKVNRQCVHRQELFDMKRNFFTRDTWMVYALAMVVLPAGVGRAQNVMAWGSNTQGQSTVPSAATNVIAVAAGFYHSLALRLDGTLVGWGSISNIPAGLTNGVSIAAGASHNLALLADTTVVAWGDNFYGQTIVPASASNVIAVAAGYYHNLALRADGTVIAWGKNANAQTNVPPSATNIVAIAAGAEHSMALREDGSVVIWGGVTNTSSILAYATTRMPRTVRDVVALSAGAYQNLALVGNGQVVSWGYNHKKPRVPLSATNVVATAAGTNYNLALRADGRIIAWGSGTITNVPPPATNAFAIAAGLTHWLAVVGDGLAPRIPGRIAYRSQCSAGSPLPMSVRAVGSKPLHYQWLADGVPIPNTDTPFPRIAAALGSDNVRYHVIISNSWGSVTSESAIFKIRCLSLWGDDLDGQSKIPDSVVNPFAISAGAFHSLAVNPDGTVAAWGKNWDGQTNVPPAATNVVAVAAGTFHSLALKHDGSVVAWGRNWDGETDVPSTAANVVAVSAGWAHSLALRADGTVVAWGNDDYGQTDFPLLTDVIAIAAGYYHNIALRADGTVVTWAFDYPTPATVSNVVGVAAGWDHCLALRADGSLVAWGDNSYGQSSIPASATNVVAISASYYHNVALRAGGTVIAWGRSYFGVTNVPAGLNSVGSIASGEDYSMVLVASGPPRFGWQLGLAIAHVGSQTILNPTVVGMYPLGFQWFHDGVAVSGATNRTLLLTNVQAADAGNYVLSATNAAGQATSQPLSLEVRQVWES